MVNLNLISSHTLDSKENTDFMKQFFISIIRISIITIFASLLLIIVVFWGIRSIYDNNYQKGFVYQYRALQNSPLDQNKLIVIGGSYMTFAVDSSELSKKLDMPVYTLGIHSGMGMEYILETAKKFVNEGDTIVFSFIPYEANQYGMDLIYLSLDGETDIFLDFLKNHPTEVIKSIGAATITKLYGIKDYIKRHNSEAASVYDARSFDKNSGNLIYKRDKRKATIEYLSKFKGDENIEDMDRECFYEVMELSNYCNHNNIEFDIIYAPFCHGYYDFDSKDEATGYQKQLEEAMNCNFMVDIAECALPVDYIYDGILHANDLGKEYYTNLIYEGLREQ